MDAATATASRTGATDVAARGRDRPTVGRPARPRGDGLALLICLALGVLSLAVLPSLAGSDVFAWVTWGHEIAHEVISPHLTFVVEGGPSWKPLPVLFTTIFGFFGAPAKLWIAFDRGLGLLGLYVAYRLGDRLGTSHGWRWAGPIAGVLGAVAIALSSEWVHYMYRATSEPMVVTAALLWVDYHLSGRRMAAFWCGVALCLMRPEASVFLIGDAAWLLWREPRVARGVALFTGLALVPLGWVVPPGLSRGHFLEASQHAHAYAVGHNHAAGAGLVLQVFKRATQLTDWPVLIAALVLTVLAVRARDRVVVALAAISLCYVAIVTVMTVAGYPGLSRFMLPAAAIACVLAAVAVTRLASLAGGGLASLAIVALVVALAAPAFHGTADNAWAQEGRADAAITAQHDLAIATRRLGGVRRMLPCASSILYVNHVVASAFAWQLGVSLTRVRGVTNVPATARRPALGFFGPAWIVLGGSPRRLVHHLHGTTIGHVGIFRITRITRPGAHHANSCVGR